MAGVLFFYVALRYQKKEFELQREELTLTRNILEDQSKTIARQQFEETFFKLLELFIKIQQQEHYDKTSVELREKYDGEEKYIKGDKNVAYLKLKSIFKKRHNSWRSSFESFASIIKSIYKFISDSEIKDPSFYSELLKSHLFRKDSLFLFVYTLYKIDKELETY